MLLKAGQTRETDTLLLGYFDDARAGLERYADAIAKAYDIHLPPKPGGVYCTWYHRNLTGSGASTEVRLAENAAFAKQHLQPFGLSVFQIDDHWQEQSISDTATGEVDRVGPVKTFRQANKNYPGGMASAADMLRKHGFVPGIWYMPFAGNLNNPYFDPDIFFRDNLTGGIFTDEHWSGTGIDPTSARGEAFLRERIGRIHSWGYRYIKVDGLHTGTPSECHYINRAYEGKVVDNIFGDAENHDRIMTFVEGYRKGLEILREQTPGAFILGCTCTQNMVSFAPVFGCIDAMRVGPDNDKARDGHWEHIARGPDYAGNLWFLNNRVWYNDPDPFYVRESVPLHKARWMASWQAVSGMMNTTSMQYSDLSPERLDLVKRTLPAHMCDARPVDILESNKPQVWRTGNDRVVILGLFNWDEDRELIIDQPFARLDLDPDRSYQAFDFWGNRYLGILDVRLRTSLAGAHCRVLALREARDYPQLLSTSRHITQGLIDVISETWIPARHTLHGTSRVVAGDPYEMRIACPVGFTAADVRTSDECAGISAIEQTDGLARVTITPSTSGTIDWEIAFNPQEHG